MSITATSLNSQINIYLELLNLKQKKALLTVAKTFASSEGIDNFSDEFKAELDSRYEEYINGTAKLFTEEEVNTEIQDIIKSRAKK